VVYYDNYLSSYGVGATNSGVQTAMQAPCMALQPAAAEVSQAHYPTGPAVPVTIP
jgi:hypothetical protein